MFNLNTYNFLLKLFNGKLSDSHSRDTSTIKLKRALIWATNSIRKEKKPQGLVLKKPSWKIPSEIIKKGDNGHPFLFTVTIYKKTTTMANIMISEEQLQSLVNKIKPIQESKDGSYMAKQQLFVIATMAHEMWQALEEGEQLDDWMESKIAQAEQSVTSVVKAFFYDEITDDQKGMGTLNYDDLVIGN